MDEARTLVGPLLDEIACGSSEDETPLAVLAVLLQAAIVAEHRAAAQALAARLVCVTHLTGDTGVHTCVARHLGDAAALMRNATAARGYYVQALESAGKIRFRPELALTHLRLAELLLEDKVERAEALEHLNIALPELRDMKMQPALERGLTLLEQVQHHAPAATAAARPDRARA
jgi:hypothetical protein